MPNDIQTKRRQLMTGVASAAALSVLTPTQLLAQGAYPNRALKMVVPWPPGQATDLVGRVVAQELGKILGQTVVIDNKAGAGGSIGTDAVAKSPPDGYTLLAASSGPVSISPLFGKTPYVPEKDLVPVAMVGMSPYVLVTGTNFPANDLREFVAVVKANPGKYNYASAGAGSAIHLAAELFKSKALVDILHVPYKGAGPALNALYSADVEMMFGSVSELKPQIITKKMRPIAVTSLSRSSALPDVPSFAESGIKDYDVPGWYGVYVPVRTPVEVLKRLREAADATLKSQGLQQLLKRYEMEPVLGGPREAGDLLETEARRWSEVVNKANITAE
jgi:tripartite-type tricarboxylate transporter receptor subunit TctC